MDGRWATVVAVLCLAGCAFEPEGARPFEPPEAYRAWFEATEACSARAGSFEAIQWFAVPGRDFACPSGRCVGRWEPGQRIYLAESWLDHEMVVRHEMLHALLDRSGHPNPPFGEGCPLTWDTWTVARRSRDVAPRVVD